MIACHKSFYVNVEEFDDDKYLLTDYSGRQQKLRKELFERDYVVIQEEKPKRRKQQLSPFELEFAKQLMEFGSLESNVEDDNYINGTKSIMDKYKSENN